MGTLYSQQPRKSHEITEGQLDSFLAFVSGLAQKHKVPVADVVASARVLELRRANDLYVGNGDIFDEQIAGIGQELQRIAESIQSSKTE